MRLEDRVGQLEARLQVSEALLNEQGLVVGVALALVEEMALAISPRDAGGAMRWLDELEKRSRDLIEPKLGGDRAQTAARAMEILEKRLDLLRNRARERFGNEKGAPKRP